jgi:hypothetical protein
MHARNATGVVVALLGAFVAVAGFEHGIGEVLQGNVAPSGIAIQSWPDSAFFRVVNGEPAMTVVPDLLATGILAIVVSLAFLIWAVGFAQRRYGGAVIILLSVVMLLVGGGFAPPLLGIIIGVAATRIDAPLTWWRTHLSAGQRRFLAGAWLYFIVACLVAWLMLFPGLPMLGYFLGAGSGAVVGVVFFAALGFMLLTLLSGFARDADRRRAIAGHH